MVFGNFEGKDVRSGSFTVEPFRPPFQSGHFGGTSVDIGHPSRSWANFRGESVQLQNPVSSSSTAVCETLYYWCITPCELPSHPSQRPLPLPPLRPSMDMFLVLATSIKQVLVLLEPYCYFMYQKYDPVRS